MAADVSRQIKSEPKSGLITRDFLGRCFGIESKELDLDLHVSSGWEKRLDLKDCPTGFVQWTNTTYGSWPIGGGDVALGNQVGPSPIQMSFSTFLVYQDYSP